MLCKIFVDNLSLETSWEFIFVTTRRSAKYLPQTRSKLATLKYA